MKNGGIKMELITEVIQTYYEVLVILGIIVTSVVIFYNIRQGRSSLK